MEYDELKRIAASALKKRGMRMDEESIHDIATTLWEDIDNFKGGHLGAWLCMQAGYHTLNRQKWYVRQNKAGKIQPMSELFDAPEKSTDTIEQSEAVEELEKLAAAAGLKRGEKSLLLLYYGHGITLRNIAKQMRVTPQAVHHKIQGLLKRLRQFC